MIQDIKQIMIIVKLIFQLIIDNKKEWNEKLLKLKDIAKKI